MKRLESREKIPRCAKFALCFFFFLVGLSKVKKMTKEELLKELTIEDIPQFLKDKLSYQTKANFRETIREEEKANFAKTISMIERDALKVIGATPSELKEHFKLKSSDNLKFTDHVFPFVVEKLKEENKGGESELQQKLDDLKALHAKSKETYSSEIDALKNQIQEKENDFELFKASQSLAYAKQKRFEELSGENIIAEHIDFDYYNLKLQKHLASLGYSQKLTEDGLMIVDKEGKQINDGKDYVKSKDFEVDFIKNNELLYKRGEKGGAGGAPQPTDEPTLREQYAAKQRAAFGG